MSDGPARSLLERRAHGDVDVLEIRVTDLYRADRIEDLGHQIREALSFSEASSFILDLSMVRYMTSAALGVLINVRSHLADRGYALALAGATGEVADVLAHARLDQLVTTYPSVEAALKALGCP